MVFCSDMTWARVCFVVMGQLGELCSSPGPIGESQGCSTHHHRLGGAMTLSCLLALSRVSFLAGFLVLFHLFDLPLQKCTLRFLQSLDGSSFSELFLRFCRAFGIAGYSDHELALMEPLPCGMHLTGTETELRNICPVP